MKTYYQLIKIKRFFTLFRWCKATSQRASGVNTNVLYRTDLNVTANPPYWKNATRKHWTQFVTSSKPLFGSRSRNDPFYWGEGAFVLKIEHVYGLKISWSKHSFLEIILFNTVPISCDQTQPFYRVPADATSQLNFSSRRSPPPAPAQLLFCARSSGIYSNGECMIVEFAFTECFAVFYKLDFG